MPKSKSARVAAAPAKKSKMYFFVEVVQELRKARWPTRQETIRLSILVIVLCGITGAVLGAFDYGFTKLVANLFLG